MTSKKVPTLVYFAPASNSNHPKMKIQDVLKGSEYAVSLFNQAEKEFIENQTYERGNLIRT